MPSIALTMPTSCSWPQPATTRTTARRVPATRPNTERECHRGGIDHQHGRDELVLELWQYHDRYLRTGFVDHVDSAEEFEGQDSQRLRQLQRHLNGDPHVAGAAALYKAAQHPGATAAQVKAGIINSARRRPRPATARSQQRPLNVSGF
jgi:hypothetical protein